MTPPASLPGGFTPGALVGAGQASQRASLVAQQRAALARVTADAAGRATLFDLVPFVALDVDEQEFLSLLASPDVDLVEEDVALPPGLLESIPLIGGDANGAFAGFTGSGTAVAILDTGVRTDHSFFGNRVVSEACYSTTVSGTTESVCPGGAASSTDPGSGAACNASISGCGHGTHVAGIAAGQGQSFSGVAKDASIIAVQVFSKFLNQASCGTTTAPCALAYTSNIISGLQRVHALKDTIPVAAVNISIGGGTFGSTCDSSNVALKAAVDALRAAGIATVIASGNNGSATGISSPACVSTAVSVGSTTKADAVSPFSNSVAFLSLLAPGSAITSSVTSGGFGAMSGTSMAAPHVAGAWAVVKSKKPTATVDEVLMALRSTGTPIVDSRNGVQVPRIDVAAALGQISSQPSALVWRHTDGRVARWTLSGTQVTSRTLLNDGLAVNTAWTLSGSADFNGDGKADLLWRHTDGRASVWYMDGSTRLGAAFFNDQVPVPTAWRLAGAGDYDGDGKPDLVWRHDDGRVSFWFMDGIRRTSASLVGTVSMAWTVVGHADLNGDLRADLLWRHTDGRLSVWYMNGAVRTGTLLMNGGVPVSTIWTLSATTDLNGDGHVDLLWRRSDGRMSVWFMNGSTRTSASLLNNGGAVDTAWTLATAYGQ